MSKGILNNRDKMMWDNTHKPDISDVVAEIDDEMDDLLDDHDDKIVDIVGDNMNDLLDAHDDKVVSIVGDNMSTLLTNAASTVQLLAGDLSRITDTGVKLGVWDAGHDLYAIRVSGTLPTSTSTQNLVLTSTPTIPVNLVGWLHSLDGSYSGIAYSYVKNSGTDTHLSVTSNYSGSEYAIVYYYLVSTT